MTAGTKGQFKRWLSSPPRPHGAIIQDRTVSNLELFYDLVYVAVISQASRQLASHVSLVGFAEFAVVFGMLWFAWFNGTMYIELHGREDGRTRLLVFLQMGILALLAVFTGGAAGASGQPFALVYAAFLALQAWSWRSLASRVRAMTRRARYAEDRDGWRSWARAWSIPRSSQPPDTTLSAIPASLPVWASNA